MKPILTIIVGIMAAVALLPLSPILLPLLAVWAISANREQISSSVSQWVTSALTPKRRPPRMSQADEAACAEFWAKGQQYRKERGLR